MQGYSLLGYVNAVRLRSSKTLLVEGVTDQRLMARLRHELGGDNPGRIDGSEILSDRDEQAFAGKGSREKILAILATLQEHPEFVAALQGKLGTLVDREWEGVTHGSEIDEVWMPPEQVVPHFKTRGHSIENYFFSRTSFRAYLVHAHPEHLSQDFLAALDQRFILMVALAFSWSMAIRDLRALGRASGILVKHVVWAEGMYQLSDEVLAFLLTRAIVVPDDFQQKINERSRAYLGQIGHEHPGVWLCHGHLGEEVLWACVAHLAREFNLAGGVAERIEKADRQQRYRYLCDFLSRGPHDEQHVPLRAAIEWLAA